MYLNAIYNSQNTSFGRELFDDGPILTYNSYIEVNHHI